MAKEAQKNRIEKRPTQFQHVYMIDWDDNGIFREIAVVKEDEETGTIFGIKVEDLHPIDLSRLKKIVTSQHADKYPLWDLMAQITLKNGYNALDFFHTNYVRRKAPRGAVVGGTMASMGIDLDSGMVSASSFEPTGQSSGQRASQMLDI